MIRAGLNPDGIGGTLRVYGLLQMTSTLLLCQSMFLCVFLPGAWARYLHCDADFFRFLITGVVGTDYNVKLERWAVGTAGMGVAANIIALMVCSASLPSCFLVRRLTGECSSCGS